LKELLQLERDTLTRPTWSCLTPYIHTCTHIPAQITLSVITEELSLLGDCPGWKNKPAETPEESPSSIFSWALAYL